MKIAIGVTTLLVSSLSLGQVALAANSNSEKLQNKIDNFEEKLINNKEDLNDASSLDLPDDDTSDDPNLTLTQLRYDAAYPLVTDSIRQIKSLKTITNFLNGISKKDKHAILTSLQEMVVQLKTYQSDMDDGLSVAADNSDDGLSEVSTAIGESRDYLSSYNDLPHDTLEEYLKNFGDMTYANYKDTLSGLNDTYDQYLILLGSTKTGTFKSKLTKANSKYSEAVALYNKGIDQSETRDLQLLNRAAKKMLQTQHWISETYKEITTLEPSL